MLEYHLKGRGIYDARVLRAMGRVPREKFLPENLRDEAYADCPLPIGAGQTISQPYIVALMTQLADLTPESSVLECGTGQGYQAAVLAEICARVHTIEIIPELAQKAAANLTACGYTHVDVKCGDAFEGWPEQGPFDAILITSAPRQAPPPLLDQLKAGGRLVVPLGAAGAVQQLTVIRRNDDDTFSHQPIIPVRFVPFTRKDQP